MDHANSATETLSVSQLNRQVKRTLESHFGFVWVEGELSNFARPGSGHWYFTLKDEGSQVRCAMFRNANQRVRIPVEAGKQVRIRARVSLYEGRGEYQLIVEHLEAAGAGALQLAFEQLKRRLHEEGLFAAELKQALPEMPDKVAIISSATGAAVRDIVAVFKRRMPAIELMVLPVPVQGEDSAPAIVRAIEMANLWHAKGEAEFNAIILSRGGGSLEDLWSFNEESVARAIVDSDIPIVSAVGHEVDFTIADLAADVRAATPSAAAELLSPDQAEIRTLFGAMEMQLRRSLRASMDLRKQALLTLTASLRHPGEKLLEQGQRLDATDLRLRAAIRNRLQQARIDLQPLQAALQASSPAQAVAIISSRLSNLSQRLKTTHQNHITELGFNLEKIQALLQTLGPEATLERGYAIVTDENGHVVRSPNQLKQGQRLRNRFAEGEVDSLVDLGD